LILLFALGALALLPAAESSPLARWILAEVLTAERLLPLVGLGVACGLIGPRSLAAAALLFALGIAAGLLAEDPLLRLLDHIPLAATHLFFAGPIAFLAVGAALAAGSRAWSWLAPVAALIVGAMAALMIKMTDPTLHQPAYTWTPIAIACWIVIAVALTLRGFQRKWIAIFARIFGSWLLAIGLLYGGASLLPKRVSRPPVITAPSAPKYAPLPGPGSMNPGLPESEPMPFPDRPKQP
jgi:hypothetical protein